MEKGPRKMIRLSCYDYNKQGAYFITICARERRTLFGQIPDPTEFDIPQVQLSSLGEVLEKNVPRISEAYPAVRVEKYVIMSNHVHFLLLVTRNYCNDSGRRDKMLIAKAMQSFKASVTRQWNDKDGPVWQSRYFDHVVRSENEFLRIWQYIDGNPAKWNKDCYHML